MHYFYLLLASSFDHLSSPAVELALYIDKSVLLFSKVFSSLVTPPVLLVDIGVQSIDIYHNIEASTPSQLPT